MELPDLVLSLFVGAMLCIMAVEHITTQSAVHDVAWDIHEGTFELELDMFDRVALLVPLEKNITAYAPLPPNPPKFIGKHHPYDPEELFESGYRTVHVVIDPVGPSWRTHEFIDGSSYFVLSTPVPHGTYVTHSPDSRSLTTILMFVILFTAAPLMFYNTVRGSMTGGLVMFAGAFFALLSLTILTTPPSEISPYVVNLDDMNGVYFITIYVMALGIIRAFARYNRITTSIFEMPWKPKQ